MIRVLVADDNEGFRRALVDVISGEADLTVVSAVADGAAAVEAVFALAPDVVVLDVSMPLLDGIAAAKEIRDRGATARVVMLSSVSRSQVICASLDAGACGFLLKEESVSSLLDGIRFAARGGRPFAPLVRELLGL